MKKFDLRKKVMYTLSTGLLACTFSFAPLSAPAVAEAGGWDLLGTVLGTVSQATMEYEQVRTYLLNWGNSPETQQKTLDETVQKYGIDNSVEHNERVSRVLNQLIDKGHYAMEPNSLPFRWRVINNDEWNAACYPNDFIEVNSGLVKDLTNDNELAAVMSHEMIHGLHQHIAKDAPKQVIYKYGASLLTMNADIIQSTLGSYISNYVTVKNTTNLSEADADEYGFYLHCSAGFNPGGFPAMTMDMAKGDTSDRNLLKEIFVGAYNHPDSQKRFNEAQKRMEEYGYNHVKVKNGSDIFIDDKHFMTAAETPELSDWENAYLIAGGICKGIHDYSTIEAWGFGTPNFLNENAYKELKNALTDTTLSASLQTMLTNSYSLDLHDKEHRTAKAKLKEAEQERNEKISTKKNKAMSPENASAYKDHFESYNKLGLNVLAFKEAEKAYKADPNNYIYNGNMSRAYNALNAEYQEKNNAWNTEYINKAIEYTDKALKICESNSIDDTYWLYSNMAYYQMQAQNYTDSNSAALKAISIKPDEKSNYRFVGYNNYKLGDKGTAIKYYSLYLSHGGDAEMVPSDLSAAVKETKPKTVTQIYDDNE
ncbi:M48 family metallopeptidase [uncultured Anaerovibrio sp.]|uniref:M48 family metallopeptidase n=1 Tax=uncultured Anaerovibrio sp. TaxID=361586 RepID=UPI0025E724C1|nr:M48 family metallopeptidase [uncultured Anaerovibrio sp.]